MDCAKREETRAACLAQTLAALAAGRKWIDRESSKRLVMPFPGEVQNRL